MQTAGGWNVILREESTTLSPDPEGAEVLTFDREGRPVAWSEGGNLYKRSLSSEIHGRRVDETGRHRWAVSPEQAQLLFRRLLARAGEVPWRELDREARSRLAEIRKWTAEDLLALRSRFDAAYRPLGILPPDQYLAVVLQATFGCSWNRCTFCSFYKGTEFGVRTPEDFRAHLEAVRELLGRGELLRKRIFLSDGDALVLSNARLVPLLRMAREAFPDRPVSGFVDVFAGLNKPAEEWSELGGLGLDRVQVGIETGSDQLLEWLDKPGTAEEARSLVAALKAAGLKVSVIFMIGVGGDRFAEDHVGRSAGLVKALPLGAGDIVYLSPFVEQPGSVYSRRAAEEGIRPLGEGEAAEQFLELRGAVRRSHPAVKVAPYDIREFTY